MRDLWLEGEGQLVFIWRMWKGIHSRNEEDDP